MYQPGAERIVLEGRVEIPIAAGQLAVVPHQCLMQIYWFVEAGQLLACRHAVAIVATQRCRHMHLGDLHISSDASVERRHRIFTGDADVAGIETQADIVVDL